MIIKIKRRQHPYAMIDNRCLDDARLSWKAVGLLAYLLSRPFDWQIRVSQLSKLRKQGREAVQTGLNELKAHGYLQVVLIRNDRGQISGKCYVVSESPDDLEATMPLNEE